MTRLSAIFDRLRAEKRCGLMPFVTGGHPTVEITEKVIPALEMAGASVIEIGFPFSDPIADGPVIAQSMHEAVKAGVTPRVIFDMIRNLRPRVNCGLVAMVSDSIVTRMGPERFVREAADAGFDGLIVPDIDLEAARPLAGLAKLRNLTLTLLIAPTTSLARMEHVLQLCSGFNYLLARVGITGESATIDMPRLSQRVSVIRRISSLPIAVGFGISKPEHVAAVAEVADAAIVGSALVRRMGQANDPVKAASEFLAGLAVNKSVPAKA